MKKNLGAKTFMYPMPVLIIGSYDENNIPDAMNVAWGGISGENQISICISEGHKTTKNILLKGEFTVSIADVQNVIAADYVGIESANKETDKIKKAGWHAAKSEFVDAPVFDELPMALECSLISYNKESGILVGKIVNICADDKILDSDGKIDLSKFNPITFDPANHKYLKIGEDVGNAFKDGMKLK
ncbi:MAG: flavin reductase [Clostridia bacterium]|nr:flavin reductase [Clostridia bacterium]